MVDNNKIRWGIIIFLFLLAWAWILPNFEAVRKLKWWISKEKIIYGLDIQGGLHLVMGVKIEEAFIESLKKISLDIKDTLNKEEINNATVEASKEEIGQIIIHLEDDKDMEKASQILGEQFNTSLLQGGNSLSILSGNSNPIVLGYNVVELIQMRKSIVSQVVEVIRRRIDEFGVNEPVITAQGEDRVLVQLPGVQDSLRAKEIIQRTARLDFSIVNEEISASDLLQWIDEAETKGAYTLGPDLPYLEYLEKINQDLKDKLGEDNTLVFQRAQASNSLVSGKIPVVVSVKDSLGGENIQSAFVAQNEFGNPVVNFSIGTAGKKEFSDLTGRNVGKKMAIILDKELKSMPVLRSRIPGEGQIELGRGGQDLLEEANMIATVLRAGALPARLVKLEERTVGPTLGREAIEKGKLAGGLALILVVVFMFIYYRLLGIVANVALCTNILFLLAMLSSLGATLTLPGVAGIILTIGMAVDANVIIYERLKEELKKGSSLALAIKDGYSYALSAILDANITTAIVCAVLMYYGTGPIRGFAVTLCCGILTSVFTAVFVSRTVLNTLVLRFKLTRI